MSKNATVKMWASRWRRAQEIASNSLSGKISVRFNPLVLLLFLVYLTIDIILFPFLLIWRYLAWVFADEDITRFLQMIFGLMFFAGVVFIGQHFYTKQNPKEQAPTSQVVVRPPGALADKVAILASVQGNPVVTECVLQEFANRERKGDLITNRIADYTVHNCSSK